MVGSHAAAARGSGVGIARLDRFEIIRTIFWIFDTDAKGDRLPRLIEVPIGRFQQRDLRDRVADDHSTSGTHRHHPAAAGQHHQALTDICPPINVG